MTCINIKLYLVPSINSMLVLAVVQVSKPRRSINQILLVHSLGIRNSTRVHQESAGGERIQHSAHLYDCKHCPDIYIYIYDTYQVYNIIHAVVKCALYFCYECIFIIDRAECVHGHYYVV